MPFPILYVKVIVAYFILCIIIGLLGRGRKMGGWGYFFSSIVLTPVIGIMLVMLSDKRH